MFPVKSPSPSWGLPPWAIDFSPAPQPLPRDVDIAIVGTGFTGLAAAAWMRLLDSRKSVVVLEAGSIGSGASGRTGGMALAETAAGDLPGLGNVLEGVEDIFEKLGVECGLALPGAWEIGRSGGLASSPIDWNDSGTLRVVREVPGGSLDPGKLIGELGSAGQRLGAVILERHRVTGIRWSDPAELEIVIPDTRPRSQRISAAKVLFATNALSLGLSGLDSDSHPRLTLAAQTAPLATEELEAIGLSSGKPFYTIDFPYLWGRIRPDNSIVWGAGLVDPPPSGDLQEVSVHSGGPALMFDKLEARIHGLHPALAGARFTHRWGGPILFRDDWHPIFDWHPRSRNGLVIGAFAGHGVALSSYLGAWAAEIFLGWRDLPKWGRLSI
jgi:glycine/D-amino acid oxidase-like deaminating enzyme